MNERSPCIAAALVGTLAATTAGATDYYASPNGNGDGTSASSPMSVSGAINAAQPGDTVYLLGGTYSGWSASPRPVRSGEPGAWITIAAAPGELPIVEDAGVGGGSYEYIRFVGLVSRGASGGFGNGWTDGNCSTMSNGNLEYINCIADGNDINGIAHYCAGGLHIKQCIVAHNGAQDPSWSSGVNLFAVQGGPDSNLVEQTISFENIDISSNHSDGSGFIMDQGSDGATFLNNVGFRNGGSCIRLTNSTNARIINNTCVHNGQDPTAKYHDEIFFSDTSTTHQGALLRNNLCIPTSGQAGLTMGNGVPAENNVFDGTASLVVSATGDLDFHLLPGATSVIDQGSATDAPGDDVGFDWRCIKQQSGQAISWWQYAVDYDYIASIGGVAACFAPGARQNAPDIGAYEYGAVASTGGTSGTGGAGTGGAETGGNPTGGAETGGASTGGAETGGASTGGLATGGALPGTGGATSGGAPTGGAPTGGASTGGAAPGGFTTGGAPSTGGQAAGGAVAGGAAGTGGAPTGGASGAGGALAGGDLTGGLATGGPTTGGGSTSGTPAGGAAASAPPEEDAGGCACSTAGAAPRGLGALLGLALGLVAVGRRRRR